MANSDLTRILELFAQAEGIERRVFALVDGFPYVLWANGARPIPSAGFGGRTGLLCLNPPENEWSLGIDLKKARADSSAMTLGIRNIPDPDDPSTYFFAKLFAPTAYSAGDNLWALFARNTSITKIDADATTISVDRSLADWPSGGLAYIGNEVFQYTSTYDYASKDVDALAEFRGVIKGRYPCVGTYWGRSYVPTSKSTDTGRPGLDAIIISTVPTGWMGRRIAIYITAWDPARQAYLPLSQSYLAWVGTISEGISYRPEGDQWLITGENILKSCDRDIATNIQKARLTGINLTQSNATYQFTLVVYSDGDWYEDSKNFTIPSGVYETAQDLRDAFTYAMLSTASGTYTLNGTPYSVVVDSTSLFKTDDGSAKCIIRMLGSDNDLSSDSKKFRIEPGPDSSIINCWAMLFALGYKPETVSAGVAFEHDDSNFDFADLISDDDVFDTFLPLSKMNIMCGHRVDLNVDDVELWTTQADTYGTVPTGSVGTVGFAQIPVTGIANGDTNESTPKICIVIYSDIDSGTFESTNATKFLTLYEDNYIRPQYGASGAGTTAGNQFQYAGSRHGEDPVLITQVYMPVSVIWNAFFPRGPFELLLYPLLSTGTTGYNDATYDVLPQDLSVGMQADLVDIESFLAADLSALGKHLGLAIRNYPITESVSWIDLLSAECQLFGFILVWDAGAGKMRLQNTVSQSTLTSADEVTDTNSSAIEFPEMNISNKNVANHWTVKLHDYRFDKKVTRDITDAFGRTVSGEAAASIDHRGINLAKKNYSETDIVTDLTGSLIVDRKDLLRYSWPVVRRTLNPTMIGKINIGDVVRFTATNFPDPFGSGAMTCDAWAFVTDRTQGFVNFTGTCTLLINARSGASSRANWAGAAFVDNTAASGGWDSSTRILKLQRAGLSDAYRTQQYSAGFADGTRFSAGDFVNVIARNPDDPTDPERYLAVEVESDFGTDHPDGLTFVTGTTLTGYDTTGATEYVVVTADYGSASAAQKIDQAFIADADTKKVGSDPARRYG